MATTYLKRGTQKARAILAVLVALALALGLAPWAAQPAHAASDGSITISNPTTGQTYTAYKIFDLAYSGSGTDTAYAYTATEAQKTFYENQTNNPFTFTKNVTGTYNVSIGTKSDGTSYSKAEVVAFLQGFITTDSNGKVSIDSGFAAVVTSSGSATAQKGDTSVTISSLSYGYYFVTSTVGTVLTVNSTTPNVTVEDKNAAPAVDKDVKEDSKTENAWGDSNTAGIGDVVEFRTKVTIPVGSVNVVVHDDMSTGLTMNANSIKVYTDENLTTELDSSNYSVTTPTAPATSLTDDCEFEVKFASTYLNGLEAETTVYVYYKATVNSSAVISGDGNENKTYVKYGNDSNIESTPSTTTTKVWEFDLHKYANNDTTGYLADAEFVLSYTEGTGDDAVTKYATFSEATTTTGEGDDAVTTVVGYKLTGWVDSKDNATHIVTNGTTAINIEGLDADTYQLTEVKAPNGYNLLGDPVTVVIAEAGTVTVGTNTTAVNEVQVQNQSGTELPSTGGIGTTIFYLIGGILVVGAGAALIVRKRKANAKH